MARPRHLRNAPIREAILDLRVKARAGIGPEDVADALRALRRTYPQVEERQGVEAEVIFGPEIQPPRSQVRDLGFQSYRLKSEDGRDIVQLRIDGFTFNRLRPYTRWEQILPAALGAWRTYAEATQPELVSRLAVRYINEIPLPPNLGSLGEFLTTGPSVPPEWPRYVSGFVTQVVVHEPETRLSATVRQSLEAHVTTREATVLLDIDAYHLGQLEPDSPEIERIFHGLRDLKNRIFFSSLTEDAVKRFE